MISIIVCSRQKEIDKKLANNIKSTIGDIIYEIIWIDNSNNEYSIFSAYNEGVRRAKYDYLCFMHEDIIFHSNNWGQGCNDLFFNNEKIGMLGIVGTHYLSKFSTYWFSSNLSRGKWKQGYGKSQNYYIKLKDHTSKDPYGPYVVAVDGVWMMIKKDLFNKIRFDDITFKGFHFYDLDICMQIQQLGYYIMLNDNILIEHKSAGNFCNQFYNNSSIFHKKWNYILPISSATVPEETINSINIEAIKYFNNLQYFYQEQTILMNKLPYKIVTKLLLLLKKIHETICSIMYI